MSQPATAAVMPEAFAKDAIISWFRGEFAAANAIIDALCGHLSQFEGGKREYESVFSAIHRRRLNWIPILQMQKYYSIADVTMELQKVVEEKKIVDEKVETKGEISEMDSVYIDIEKNNGGEVVDDDSNKDNHSPKSGITDAGMLYNLYTVKFVAILLHICYNSVVYSCRFSDLVPVFHFTSHVSCYYFSNYHTLLLFLTFFKLIIFFIF
ncbi:hypothetical protein Hanom_Chr05g00404981 [Helianthus anomalus]